MSSRVSLVKFELSHSIFDNNNINHEITSNVQNIFVENSCISMSGASVECKCSEWKQLFNFEIFAKLINTAGKKFEVTIFR